MIIAKAGIIDDLVDYQDIHPSMESFTESDLCPNLARHSGSLKRPAGELHGGTSTMKQVIVLDTATSHLIHLGVSFGPTTETVPRS